MREGVVRGLVATGKWAETTARLGERADYKCEYCGLDLLASPENYKLWTVDHIVPTSCVAEPDSVGDPNSFDNLAVACWTCNFCFKSRWNPRVLVGPGVSRGDLIRLVRDYIEQRKERTESEIARVRRIVGRSEPRQG